MKNILIQRLKASRRCPLIHERWPELLEEWLVEQTPATLRDAPDSEAIELLNRCQDVRSEMPMKLSNVPVDIAVRLIADDAREQDFRAELWQLRETYRQKLTEKGENCSGCTKRGIIREFEGAIKKVLDLIPDAPHNPEDLQTI